MKAYTVHKFLVCQYTGEVIAKISFNDEAFEKSLPNVEFANTYIAKSKRDWFLSSLEKYISHKKQIIENSQVSPEKQKALTVCSVAYNDFLTKALPTMVARFVKGKQFFELILPHTSNASYTSSKQVFDELIKFCETELKQVA